jgi:hypothetical protein
LAVVVVLVLFMVAEQVLVDCFMILRLIFLLVH